jgi:hypothetical protein
VTWNDRNSAPVSPPRAVAARVVAPQAGAPPVSFPVPFERRPSEPRRSRFRLHLPGPRMPITALELSCGGGHLLRQARVNEPQLSGTEVVPVAIGSALLRRAIRDDLVAADLRISINRPEGTELELVVDDGDNPPLELLAVSAELAPLPWIYFESAAGAPLAARFGAATLAAPRYDLEAMRESVSTRQVAEAHWGDVRTLGPPPAEQAPAGSPLPAIGAPVDVTAFRFARKIPPGPLGLTALVLDPAVLAHSTRLADLRIADARGYQVPYLLERLEEPMSVDLGELAHDSTGNTPPSHNESHYRITLPYDRLPSSRLVLSTTARVFDRALTLQIERPPVDKRSSPRRQTIGSNMWRHTDPDTPAPTLVVDLPPLDVSTVALTISEGDNSPLPLSPARLLLPAYRLRFFRTNDDPLDLLYGQPDLAAPRYDLALLAPRVLGATAREVQPDAEASAAALPAKHGTTTETKVFWGVLIVAVAVLVFLIARLVTKGEPA